MKSNSSLKFEMESGPVVKNSELVLGGTNLKDAMVSNSLIPRIKVTLKVAK